MDTTMSGSGGVASAQSPSEAEGAVRQAERMRCECLMRGDVAGLSTLMSEDLVHVHGDGRVDGKAAYLDGVAGKYRFSDVARHDLRIRIYGDVAVVVGRLTQKVTVQATDAVHDIQAVTTQTWNRTPTGWVQSTCHNAFLPRT